ncbi:hypothetical protein VR46_14610 [Streptomyces sp. NRRL S-444]|nr:hypothetical protein VR46_14610 [Streptomyces sp. NRRL S-444]
MPILAVAAAEADLDLVHAERPVLAEGLGDRLRLAGEGAAAGVPAGLADVQRLGDRAELDGVRDPGPGAELLDPGDLARQPVARVALREPAVAANGGPAHGGGRRAADPDGDAGLGGAGQLAEVLEGEQFTLELRVLLGPEGGAQRVQGLVEEGSAAGEVGAEDLELLLHVAGADAEDQPAAREVVEGGVLLGAEQRVAQAQDRDVAQQADVLGDPGQEGEGGHRVVPDGAHGSGEPARDGDVVTGGDVPEAGPVGGPRHLGEVDGGGRGLPGLGVDGALRLDRELHPVDQPALRKHARHAAPPRFVCRPRLRLPMRVPPAPGAIVVADGPSGKGFDPATRKVIRARGMCREGRVG